MDILPIQGTSVPCERVFSSSKETVRARRNCLGPKVMEATQVLKFQAKQEIDFTVGLNSHDEEAELEGKEEAAPVEDIKAYLRGINEE
jgi:hAT family C-terminal dimerisation region